MMGPATSRTAIYDVAIDNLEAGTYVFAADIQNSGTQTGINVMLFDSGWNLLFSSGKIGHVQTTFTLKSQTVFAFGQTRPV